MKEAEEVKGERKGETKGKGETEGMRETETEVEEKEKKEIEMKGEGKGRIVSKYDDDELLMMYRVLLMVNRDHISQV